MALDQTHDGVVVWGAPGGVVRIMTSGSAQVVDDAGQPVLVSVDGGSPSPFVRPDANGRVSFKSDQSVVYVVGIGGTRTRSISVERVAGVLVGAISAVKDDDGCWILSTPPASGATLTDDGAGGVVITI